MKSETFSIRIPENIYKELEFISVMENISKNKIIKDLLEKYIEEKIKSRKEKIDKLIGSISEEDTVEMLKSIEQCRKVYPNDIEIV